MAGAVMSPFRNRLVQYAGIFALAIASPVLAQVQVGDNVHLNASGLADAGYSGTYGNMIPSSHGLDFGLNGALTGDYFNPNFLSFTVTPYYNQSRADSDFQSLSDASGVAASANIFGASRFPGSVSYHYDYNSTGTFGLASVPNFTTQGTGHGFSINWSALFPDWPTLSVGYSQGSGHNTLYGTDQESTGENKTFNLHSGYKVSGFLLNAYYDHNSFDTSFPQFLSNGSSNLSDTAAQDYGIGATHNLPMHGSFYANFNRSSADSSYLTGAQQTSSNTYTTDSENSGVSFHPTNKLSLFATENFTDNLAGSLEQALISSGITSQNISLGSSSHSVNFGGGATYQLAKYLTAEAQATHYEQYYFGNSISGTYASGTLDYGRRLLDMFTLSGSVIDNASNGSDNSLGFMGNVNYFHRFGAWETSGNFSYAQNVQTLLITYTTSSYNYSVRLRHPLPFHIMWISAFNGSHSGLTNQPGSTDHAESYTTSLSMRRLALTGNYSKGTGNSILGSSGLVVVQPTPGLPLSDLILYGSTTYGGGITVTPLNRLSVSGTYNRAISNTLGISQSHNDTGIFNAQLQYRLRRISVLGGWTQYSQGISAIAGGPPARTSAFFLGISRWFNIF